MTAGRVIRIEVDLPEAAALRLMAEAQRLGLTVEGVIQKLASELPTVPSGPGRRPVFVAFGVSQTGITDQIEETLAEGFGRD